MTPKRKSYRRGHPVAVLIGLDSTAVTMWDVFSRVIKPSIILHIEDNESTSKAIYNLYEKTINALRPTFQQGVKSVILASPPRTTHARDFRDHVERHHSWLLKGATKVAFAELTGTANSLTQVTALARNPAFQEIVQETTTEETASLVELLEARLNMSSQAEAVLYSVKEAENLILRSKNETEAEYLLLTEKYLAEHSERWRLNRLLQVAANKRVKTRIINAESPAGKRLAQLGGFVCLRKSSLT